MSVLQRSSDWYEQRRGRFTASDSINLISDGRREMTPEELIEFKKNNPKSQAKTTSCIGESMYSLAFEKAYESVFGIDENWNVDTWDMKRGVSLEPYAFELYRQKKHLDFIDVELCSFIKYGDDAGASPDGLVLENNQDEPLEIKCPKPKKFFTLVHKGIEAIDPDYIVQMNMQMLVCDSDTAHFWNYIFYNGQDMTHEIIVRRDEEIVKKIIERLPFAIEHRNKCIEELIKNKQF